jgi:putative spermidine/putrescine transport system ATP-binding protein
MAPAVELVGITKRYGHVSAVDGVDLQIPQGSFFSLLGPSGCGQTTLLRLVAGLVSASSGIIRIQGEDVTNLPPERRQIGIVFQNYALFPHMTVFKNIAYGLRLRKKAQDVIRQEVAMALKRVGLQGMEERLPRQLSGGQQQRVALARVLVTQPRVLLLDEPLSALDKRLREEMQFWLKSMQQSLGITTMYVTHDQVEALTMADIVAVMHKGNVVRVGLPREIYSAPGNRFVHEFLGESNLVPGTIVDRAGDLLCVEIAPHVRLHATFDGGTWQPGQRCTVSVRPEDILLGSEVQARGVEQADVLQGTIVSSIFRGATVRYNIALTPQITLVAETQSKFQHGDGLDTGRPVAVAIPQRRAAVVTER